MTVRTTHNEAVENGEASVEPGDVLYGVVRNDHYLADRINRNHTALAPPKPLAKKWERVTDAIETDNPDLNHYEIDEKAWHSLNFGEQYREHIETDEHAKRVIDRIIDRAYVDEGHEDRTVWLVGWKHSSDHAHRRIVREHISDRMEAERGPVQARVRDGDGGWIKFRADECEPLTHSFVRSHRRVGWHCRRCGRSSERVTDWHGVSQREFLDMIDDGEEAGFTPTESEEDELGDEQPAEPQHEAVADGGSI